MDQHPVPQNISSYEFRLVGDMTLKQFFQLAGGLLVAFIFIKSPLPFILKWPLAIASSLTGVLLAFVPIQGRPFSQWLMAFFKAVYSPTEYNWKQSPSSNTTQSESLSTKHLALSTNPLDKLESQLISRFTELFNSATHLVTPAPHTILPKPNTEYRLPITPPKPTPPSPQPLAPSTTLIPSPTYPNIVAGVVLTPQGQSIEGVIVEIIDSSNGLPVRALRTNRLGQFQIATPLPNGSYQLSYEKPGLTFPTTQLKPTGDLIPPIIIKSLSP